MRIPKKLLTVLFLPLLLLPGCATSFTELTPQTRERATNDLYVVEVSFDNSRQDLRWESIRAKIVVGNQSYPMRLTALMTNRWEGYIPVPPGVDNVRYHYRFDFNYNSFGKPKSDSVESQEYTLRVKPR